MIEGKGEKRREESSIELISVIEIEKIERGGRREERGERNKLQ